MINFITSINPNYQNKDYLNLCINSMRKHNTKIFSINSIKEAKNIIHNNIICYPTDNTAWELIKRDVPSLLPMIRLSNKLSDVICIINSDIFIKDDSRLWYILDKIKDDELWYSSRTDIDDIEKLSNPDKDIYGFDWFAFRSSSSDKLLNGSNTFYFGEPCWDFWLPLQAIKSNFRLFNCNDNLIYHLRHPKNWTNERYELFSSALKWWITNSTERNYTHYNDIEGFINWTRNYIKKNSFFIK